MLGKKIIVRNSKNFEDVVAPIVSVQQHGTAVHISGATAWLDQDEAEYNWLSRLGDGAMSARDNAWIVETFNDAEAEELAQAAKDLLDELGYECPARALLPPGRRCALIRSWEPWRRHRWAEAGRC